MLPLKELDCCHGFYRCFSRYFYYPSDSGPVGVMPCFIRTEGQRLRT